MVDNSQVDESMQYHAPPKIQFNAWCYFIINLLSVTFRIIAITQDMLPVKRGSITIYIRVTNFNKETLIQIHMPGGKLLRK